MNPLITILLGGMICYGFFKKVDIYKCFINGAEDGLKQGVHLVPYFLAIMFPVYLWKNLGITNMICSFLSPILQPLGLPNAVLPLMLMRPLSGSAALGILSDILADFGPDSLEGILASIYQGGTDTTLFVITVYFGSVGISQYRYALKVGLLSDLMFYIAGLIWLRLLFTF